MSTRRIFALILTIIVLMGGCAYALEGSNRSQRNPDATVAATFDPSSTSGPETGSNKIEFCSTLVAKQPGDVEIVLSWGWEIVCVQSGDPILFEHGDFYTLGYADPETKKIAIAAGDATESTIAHEAAHAIDFEQLTSSDTLEIAKKYGSASWSEGEDYWNIPSEMFAEGRMRCLGFESDSDFGKMSCEDIDYLISKTEKASEINQMARNAG